MYKQRNQKLKFGEPPACCLDFGSLNQKVRHVKVAECWESWKKAADNQKTKWTECTSLTRRGKF